MAPSDFQFVQDAVRRQAELFPGRAALIDASGATLDYRALMVRAARLARGLRDLGIGPEIRVAIHTDRSVDQVVSLLAILEAGGVYVPIDVGLPASRVALLVSRVRPAVIITDRELPAGVDHHGLVVLPAGVVAVDRGRIRAASPRLHPDNLAYVIHTSGSTGVPKGVAMTHRGLTRLIRWQLGDGESQLTTLHFAPSGFDVALQEIFATLCDGGALQLIPEETRRDFGQLATLLAKRPVQRLFLPYVALQELAKAWQRSGAYPRHLRHVITAGERLIVSDAIRELFEALPHCRLDNHYGPTEAHLVTRFTLPGDRSRWPARPPIGNAVDAAAIRSLDANLAPTSPVESGELYVGGDCLARGYLGAPDLTAERFLPDPHGDSPGARMYRTGDIVRVDDDGCAEFLGREDGQLKLRGYRVEPTEVELALLVRPEVRQAVVGLRSVAAGVDVLVAYVVAPGNAFRPLELAIHLRDSLPAYMVPARFVRVDAMPLTPSGKIDRRALSRIELPGDAPEPCPDGASPIDVVRATWERILGHSQFQTDDDFFDVGGDSLLAVWMLRELSEAAGRELDLGALLDDSTLAGVAGLLEGHTSEVGGQAGSEAITLRAGAAARPLFLVHPLGGEVLAYRELARNLANPMRVLGLRWRPAGSPGLVDAASPSLAEMAAAHLAQLRAIQSSGPYRLAGWSFGGVLAFEMAQQLLAGGHEVEFLGLLDANPVIDPISGLPMPETRYLERVAAIIEALRTPTSAVTDQERLPALLADPTVTALLGHGIPSGVTAAHLHSYLRITEGSMRAVMDYQARPYRGRVHLFQAAEASRPLQAALAGALQRLVTGRLRAHQVPGDHAGMLRPGAVEALARAIDDALADPTHD